MHLPDLELQADAPPERFQRVLHEGRVGIVVGKNHGFTVSRARRSRLWMRARGLSRICNNEPR